MSRIFDFDTNIPDYGDFRKKYSNTIVMLGDRPVYVQAYDDKVVLNQITAKGGEDLIVHPSTSGVELGITPWMPPGGWIYTGKGLLAYVRQMPSRQWRRSYCSDNYALCLPYAVRAGLTVDSKACVQQLFAPPKKVVLTPDFPSKVPTKYSGAAIDAAGDFAISRYEENTWALITPTGVVGYVNPATNTIFITKISKQEVLDITRGVHEWTIKTI